VSKKKRIKALFSHWMTEPTPENILCHLHEKTEGLRTTSGFSGEMNPVEKQLIGHITGLRQQVLELTDVIQALLIIEDERMSHKMKRAFRRVLEAAEKLWRTVKESTPYKIYVTIAVVGTLASQWTTIRRIVVWLFHRFWHFT